MLIQLDLTENLNTELKVFTAQKKFKNMKEAALHILKEKLEKKRKI